MKIKTETKQLIPDNVQRFLETTEGKRFFVEISGTADRRTTHERKRSFLHPPANVRRWLDLAEKLNKKVNNLS